MPLEAKEKLFLSNEEEQAMVQYNLIHENKRLENFEKQGFLRGVKKKKTMNVDIFVLFDSLGKQYRDLVRAYGINDKEDMKRCLADLRNVAGCLFLKVEEQEGKKNE
jgi:hypothetical protein